MVYTYRGLVLTAIITLCFVLRFPRRIVFISTLTCLTFKYSTIARHLAAQASVILILILRP